MIVKGSQLPETASVTMTAAERRECLIEAWATIFERELRAHLEESQQQAVASDPSDDGCSAGE